MNKYIYKTFAILAMCVCMIGFVSCEDDDNVNTAACVVSMGETTFSIKESKGIFTIPILASGDRNGDVIVNVEVEADEENCVENKHFFVTSKRIRIPKNKESVNVEIKAVDDRVVNEDRVFTVRIVSVSGATVSETQASTLVTLRDNDDDPYERLAGRWKVVGTAIYNEGIQDLEWVTTISTLEDDDPSYGKVLIMSPWLSEDYTFFSHTLQFKFDTASNKASLSLPLGTIMAEDQDFGTDENGNDFSHSTLKSASINSMSGSIVTKGSCAGEVSADFSHIVFNIPFLGVVTNDQNQQMLAFYFDRMELTLIE